MLTQDEADALLALPKKIVSSSVALPGPGNHGRVELESIGHPPGEHPHKFVIHITRARRLANKFSLHLQTASDEFLVRVDTGTVKSHFNPSKAPAFRLQALAGQKVPTPHLQRYVESQNAFWAEPPPNPPFTNPNDLPTTWTGFLTYCNAVAIEGAQGGLL